MEGEKSAKILVIEDNVEVRENIAEILELDGYKTLTAQDGKEGIQLAQQHFPDLILCDIMMPELDGYGVLKIVKRNEKLRGIPFIFLTAKSEKQDFRKGMSLGADDFLMKPFDDVDLLESIEVRLKLRTNHSYVSRFWHRGMKKAEIDSGIQKLREASSRKATKIFAPKESVFKSGEHVTNLLYIRKGVLKSSVVTDSGKEMVTGLFKENDIMGIVPCLLNSPYNEDCTALIESEIELIPVADCEKLIQEDPGLLIALNFILAHHSTYLNSRSIDLAYSTVRKKVANALLLYQEAFASERFPCLREDLSCLAAIAKETLIRTLSDFKKEGLINIFLHEIEVLQPEKLRNMLQ